MTEFKANLLNRLNEIMEHNRIDNTHCSCGFSSDSYRGLNSHIGNINNNHRYRDYDTDINGNEIQKQLTVDGNQIRGTNRQVIADNRLEEARSKRQLAEEFIGVIHDICEERDILELLEQTNSDTYGFQWRLWHDLAKLEDKPYLFIAWNKTKPKYLTVKMLSKITRYSKRINLSKPEKFKAIIEESIATLTKQNEQYEATERLIQAELDKIKDVEVNRMKRHTHTWQIDISYEGKDRGLIIQYDEKTEKYLFQIRYAEKDVVFNLLKEALGEQT
jgi:hypothetical protein